MAKKRRPAAKKAIRTSPGAPYVRAAAPAAGSNLDEGIISRFQDLEPTLQLRIRRTVITCGVWMGLVLASAGVFLLCKPLMDRRREERILRGVKPLATPKPFAPYARSRRETSRTESK